MFNDFWPYYKKWVHHGAKFLDFVHFFFYKGHNTANTQPKSGLADIDTMEILSDIFGMRKNRGSGIF